MGKTKGKGRTKETEKNPRRKKKKKKEGNQESKEHGKTERKEINKERNGPKCLVSTPRPRGARIHKPLDRLQTPLSVLVCFLSFFKIIYLFIYLFIYLWLCWIFVSVRGLSLVAASGGHSSSRCAGLSLSRPLLLRSTGSRRAGSGVVAHGPSCSAACGIFPDQGSNPCSLHWQADSQPLRQQGSPFVFFCSVLDRKFAQRRHVYLCLLLVSTSRIRRIPMHEQ